MVNWSPNKLEEFTLPNGDVPSSTTIIIGLSSIGRSNITKLVPKSNQQLATLQQQTRIWASWNQKSIT
jgi:hypothetical protein